MDREEPAIRWLLNSDEPGVRYFTRIDVLDEPADAPPVQADRHAIFNGPRVRGLLAGQRADGGFGVHPYKKWDGAHWRLVSLVELGLPAGDPRALAAVEQVLGWLTGESHRSRISVIDGRTRRCASQEGNALAVCCRLGLASDSRVAGLARDLVAWQWPDGGWNCDKHPEAHHSSFYESLAPLWGLVEYQRATGDEGCRQASRRAAEFFLRHRLFRSETSGDVIHPEWLKLHYPLYWHYDILQGLRMLGLSGVLGDARAQEALRLVRQKRRADGCWRAEGRYWRAPGGAGSNIEVVDWGRRGPSEMITLNALRVLKMAGDRPNGSLTKRKIPDTIYSDVPR